MPEDYVEDEFEKEVAKLIPQLKKKNLRKRVSILEQAAVLIEKSANPESQQIRDFLLGMSKRLQGSAEKDNIKAIQFMDEALAFFEKVNIDGSNIEYHRTKIMRYRRELDVSRENHSKYAEICLKISEENLALGDTKEYHVSKGLYHLFSSMEMLLKDPYAALKEINESIEEFSIISDETIIAKLNASKLRILAAFQPDPQLRLELLNQTLKEIQKTGDKFGFYECRGQVNYLKGQIERNWKNKIKLFTNAAKDFKRDGFNELCNSSLGAINFWRAHDPSLGIDEAIKLLTDAAHHYDLVSNRIDFENAMGVLFMLKSISEGIMKNDDAGFTGNLVEANKHFAKSLPSRELNLTAGLILFAEASKFKPEKAKDILRKAAEILKIINEKFYHHIYYQYYLVEARLAEEDIEAITRYQQEALSHLEAWLAYRADAKKSKARTLELPFDPEALNDLFSGEYYFLKGRLEEEPIIREALLKKSLSIYSSLIDRGIMLDKVLRAKGWVCMFLDELDIAVSTFDEACRLNPSSETLNQDKTFATEQLKAGFRDLKESIVRESKFRLELQEYLNTAFGNVKIPYSEKFVDQIGQNFTQSVIREIQKAGKTLEENYPLHKDKDEEGLRDELNQCLKMIYHFVSGESKKAKGKRDINILNKSTQEELTAECLIWNGEKYYLGKKEQLFDRYLTWHNKEAALICFIRDKDFEQTINAATEAIKCSYDLKDKSFVDLCQKDSKLFITEHRHKSGVIIRIYHLFFHIPKN